MEELWYDKVMKEHTAYWKSQEKSGFNPDTLPGINRGKINVVMGAPQGLGKSNFNPWESLFETPNKLLLVC